MGKVIAFFLSLSLFFCLLAESTAAEKITQETKGSQSPAVFLSPGAISNINYTTPIDQIMSEVHKEFSRCMEVTIAFQSKKLEELNKKLARLLVENEGIPEDDARQWAKELVEKSPGFKKEIETNKALIQKYNKELSNNLAAKVYKAFSYIFENLDSRFLALKDLNPKTKYDRDDKFVLFSDENISVEAYTIRVFVFANENHINITLIPGKMKQGLVQKCPSIVFSEYEGKNLKQSFIIIPHYGGKTLTFRDNKVTLKKESTVKDIKYLATGADVLTESFKENFNSMFTSFVKLAFAR